MSNGTTLNRRAFLQAVGTTAAGAALAGTGASTALAARAKDVVTVQFWSPTTDVLGKKIMQDITNAFNKSVGKREGIFVKMSIVPTTNEYVKYTTAMTASSGSPDVVMTYSYDPIISWASNGYIQPMDRYAKAVGVKKSDYFPVAWDMINIGGHIWGMMQEFDFQQFAWNKNIHKGPPPKTRDELDALSAKYTKFDKHGNLTQVGLVPWVIHNPLWYDWSAAFGASYYDNAAGKWTINTPQNRAMLEWYLKYVHILGGNRTKADSFVSAAHDPNSGTDYLFYAGKMAFEEIGEFKQAPQGGEMVLVAPKLLPHVGVAQVPTVKGVPYGTNITGGGNVFLLPTKSQHPREAAVFITYAGGFQAVKEWNIREGNFPPVKAVVFSEEFKKALPYMSPWTEVLAANRLKPPIQSPQFPLFHTQMQLAIDNVTFKKRTPAQALSDVASKVSAAVQQFKLSHPTWPTE
jgi:ABC-type glycerol-3-phosphate transport system substrate-binding protein